MARTTRRLLSIAHSYCVALNRRLAHEMALAGKDQWEVVSVAPRFMKGDLRPIHFEQQEGEACQSQTVPAYLTGQIPLMYYGRRLRQLLRESWDLVHMWEEPYILAGGQIARWTHEKTPLCFWTAQNLVKNYPPPFSWIERYCLQRCSGWLACGQSIVDTLVPRGYGAKPHRIMPLGVDLNAFTPDSDARRDTRHRLGWAFSGPPVVGYSGRFVMDKGVDLLIRALDRVETPWRALFIGGGPLEDRLRQWARQYGDRVRVVTGLKHMEVPAYLNAMDVLCAPSQTMPKWREQFGRMLIEAFACGVPVIGSDSGEIPYVIAEAGKVVSESDEACWSETIAGLLDSPVCRNELSSRGRERAASEFAWPVIAHRHLEFFSEILDSQHSRTQTTGHAA